jgi:hypothetical protein
MLVPAPSAAPRRGLTVATLAPVGLNGSLSASALTVVPGETVVFELRVTDDGAGEGTAGQPVVLKVGGPGRPFSYIVPETVTIAAGGSETVRVGFRVPRTSVPAAGPLPFDVRAEGLGIVLAEGVVDVAPFSILSATIDPVEVSGRGPGRHTVTVSNRGNAPVNVTLAAYPGEGIDVGVDPPVVVPSPEGSASATVEVTPKSQPFTGDTRTFEFKVVATAEGGKPVEVGGRLVQQVAVATRKVVASGVVVAVLVLALVLGLTVFNGGSPSGSAQAPEVENVAANDACPAEGRRDNYGVSGMRPEDIPRLPNAYSFLHVMEDGCTPVRFNPCEPVHYVQNSALAPPTGAADVREAFAKLSRATGITFVDDGETDEVARARSNHYLPERYGERWAPILVSWTRFPSQGNDPTIQAVGRGIGHRVGDVLVSGQLSLNVDAVTDREARTPLDGGFGPEIGSGVGAIGPKGVTWGRIILHELAHVIGLGHTRDKGAIMYPESAEQTGRPSEFQQPDLQGIRYLGREMGCLATPPVPGA